ncbi:MAG: penicillin acylase family protein [Actinomycetota bacterium]
MSDDKAEEPDTKPRRLRKVWRVVLWSALGLTIVAIVAGAMFARYSVSRAFPQTEGTIHIAGLDGDVEIIRDSMGVPHIYADTPRDLFLAQGYVHAQDRFFQMDFWRHISYGRLSEIFGDASIETDTFIRTLGWGPLAEMQYQAETDEGKSALDAYALGVNAYLETQSPSDLSFEYSIIEIINHDYTPEPWTGAQSLAWGKVMAWDLGGNMDSEIGRSMALGVLPPERVSQLYPPYPGDRNPYIIDGAPAEAGTPAALHASVDARDELGRAAAAIEAVNKLTGGGEETGIGSNSWAVSGDHTPTGMPYLMNDPHLGSQMPSIWYQVGLHCRAVTDECPYDVAGFSFAGSPGVIIGHNADIAWGFTNVGPDVEDLYIEKLNPANPDQYEVNGEWVDMDIRTETIEVAGGESQEITIRSTRHGPVISGVTESLDDFDNSGIDTPPEYAIALRWTGLDEGLPSLVQPVLGINQASNFDEFKEAALLFAVPSQNMLYADTQGNIGYVVPGNIPIRASGNGTLPVPGWTDDNEWTGIIPYDELPWMLNPESGYIVTANNAVIPEGDYPYLITKDWSYGHRAKRILSLVTSNFGIPLEDHMRVQFDSHDPNAARILPFLTTALASPGVEVSDTARVAINQLEAWDLQDLANSAGAAVWNATWKNLLELTFQDELPEQIWPGGNSRWFEVVGSLVDNPNDPFWDDVTTPDTETRDDILVAAFVAAVDELTGLLGSDASTWTWGAIHEMTFINASLGASGIAIIEDRFNRGPYPASGSAGIVNAVGWTTTEGFAVDWLPSMRMLVDLADLSNSLAVHTTGQSGHVDHEHYDDMIPLWLNGQNVPFLWERADIRADAQATLFLKP